MSEMARGKEDAWDLVTRQDSLDVLMDYMESVKDFPKYYY